MEIELRFDRPGDRLGIVALAEEIVADGTVFPFEDVAGVLAYWYAPRARRAVAVATESGDVVGTYALKPNQPDRGAHVANAGYMVSESARGLGIGRALGEHSIDEARRRGYRAMQFNMVVASNGSAVRLWERLGFEVAGTLPGAFRHSEHGFVDAFVMYRSLDS